ALPAVRVLERGTEVRGPGDEQGGPCQGPAALRRGRLRPRDRRVPRRLRIPWRRSDLQGLYGIRCRARGRSAFGRGSAKVLRLLERGARRRRVRRILLPAGRAPSRSHALLIVPGETAKVSRR